MMIDGEQARENTTPSLPDGRLRVVIQGAVQGVGFRPFVYRLAHEHGVMGWIVNDTQGVVIEAEGAMPALTRFLADLSAHKPPRAIIHTLGSSWLDPVGYDQFEIRPSDGQGSKTALVLPDIATCSDCLEELFNPADRRYRYPFINCTNCGPRFSIIQALPYDRPHTTMRHFQLCAACQAEYDDPVNRRFHAQPNACPVCGPHLALWERASVSEAPPVPPSPTGHPDWMVTAEHDQALQRAVDALRAGQIVAIKGLGGFHLMVDAYDASAIARLRERKQRPDKPFALMVGDLDQARMLCVLSPRAEVLLTAPEAPIVLLQRRLDAPIAANVAPGMGTLGLMLPATPLHHLLLHALDRPLVTTSGNVSDEPICIDEDAALQRLSHIADLFLVHNRPIQRHIDDSIAWVIEDTPCLVRRARGYVPLPVVLARPVPTILAVGAHLKNTVALSVERQVFISQHIGDLETPEAISAFERVIADFLQLYEATPMAIAHDLHPDYLSTSWAHQPAHTREWSFALDHQPTLIAVQHHHAHLAACLAEHGIAGQALGVTWDGTGYGTDGMVWGGEFLLGDSREFQRVAHLRPFRLPGGEAAIREPRRVAFALLWALYGTAAPEQHDLPPIRAWRPWELQVLSRMLQQGINAPWTTSAGRLFDALAAFVGLQQQVSFAGQAAMALESLADPTVSAAYPLELHGETPPFILDWQPMVVALLADLRRGVAPARIAACCHNGLVKGIVAVARAVGEQRVALTGGCFQNRLLLERTTQQLRAAGFEVLFHRQVPPNDGGISLGQVAVAAARLDVVQATGDR